MNQDFWDQRYREHDTGWDVGEISTPLKHYIDQLEDKSLKILIPGAGNGHEAEYLFKNGFTSVYIVDISPLAVANFKKRVPQFPSDRVICNNFFEFDGQFDTILEQTFFCALDPRYRTAYVEKIAQLLQPNGKLVGLLFDEIREDGPPFGGTVQEYISLFSTAFTIKLMEPCYNSIDKRAGREVFINLEVKRS